MPRPNPPQTSTQSGIWLGRLLLMLLIAYPFVLHLGVLNNHMQPALLLLLGLLLLSGLLMLTRGNRYGWLPLTFLLATAAWIFAYQGEPQQLLKLPPILINAILCMLFGYTLLPGQRPLISRFAETLHGHALDAMTLRYTRGVTLLWSSVFALMALESLLLGLLARPAVWSLFTHFINYLVLLLVFFFEYRLRLRRLRHLEQPGFFGFLYSLSQIDWRRLW
jgi:uncharacterized membrane protein